jgi:hypothetical protein
MEQASFPPYYDWLDQLVSDSPDGTQATQSETPMDPGDSYGTFTDDGTGFSCFFSANEEAFQDAPPRGPDRGAGGGPIHGAPPMDPCAAMHVEYAALSSHKVRTRANCPRELQRRLDKIERDTMLAFQTIVLIQKALSRWSNAVNKTLLEIAKAVGIPLHYRNGTVCVEPTYPRGASLRFTTAVEPFEGQVRN